MLDCTQRKLLSTLLEIGLLASTFHNNLLISSHFLILKKCSFLEKLVPNYWKMTLLLSSSLQQRVSLDQDQMVMGFLQSRSLFKFLMRATTTLNIIWGSYKFLVFIKCSFANWSRKVGYFWNTTSTLGMCLISFI